MRVTVGSGVELTGNKVATLVAVVRTGVGLISVAGAADVMARIVAAMIVLRVSGEVVGTTGLMQATVRVNVASNTIQIGFDLHTQFSLKLAKV